LSLARRIRKSKIPRKEKTGNSQIAALGALIALSLFVVVYCLKSSEKTEKN
jgi:hypothetical protein